MTEPYFKSNRFLVCFPEKLGFQTNDFIQVENIQFNFETDEWEPVTFTFQNTSENFIYKKLVDFIYYIRNKQVELPLYIKIDLLNNTGEVKTRFLLEIDDCSFIKMGDLNLTNEGILRPILTVKPYNVKIETF
jgi:hypothetical protein